MFIIGTKAGIIKEEHLRLFEDCDECMGHAYILNTRCEQCEGTGWKGGNFALFILNMYWKQVLGDEYVGNL